ncbi:MAG: hypothetical protein JWM74_6273 [Myxococcaceae bacterium]|nr:hypothetical protein [Myxococcaceae bacterium]
MAYRGDLAALETKRAILEQRLQEITAKARELDGLKDQEADLRRELASTTAILENLSARRSLPVLDTMKIASPCTASWDEMKGDDRVRFCGGCEKNVYNLSAMAREEAESLLRAKEGNLCARLYRRADGTVLTADCPVGAKRVRRRRLALATVGGGVLSAMAALGVGAAVTVREAAVMGKMEAMPGPTTEEPQEMPMMGELVEEPRMEMGDVAAPVAPKVATPKVSPRPIRPPRRVPAMK